MTTPTSRAGSSRRGLTVIELIVVIALIGVLSALAAPRLASRLGSAALASAARRVLAMARYAQSFAVARQCSCRMAIDSATGRFGLEYQPDPDRAPTEFRPMPGSFARRERLPDGVRFEKLAIGADDAGAADDRTIDFFATGCADGAVVQVGDGREVYSIVVSPSSGRARLTDRAVSEVPGDRKDLDG